MMGIGIGNKIDMDARHDPAVTYQQTADNRQKRRLFQMNEDHCGLLLSQILHQRTNDPQNVRWPPGGKVNPGYLWREASLKGSNAEIL